MRRPETARRERGMSSQRLLIRNGFDVSMDPDVGHIPNGDVLVEDGAIVEVGRGLGVSGT
jgi:5-methylthioadenosine/S-adenosylhomocysteine deaminase